MGLVHLDEQPLVQFRLLVKQRALTTSPQGR
ncbi:hypothetical protein NC651_004062 [Populus alba x Populus x berolinensis]|nr:hypothetical protein NC651_004062 [Populus alba x Populus x berolinensis]